MRFDNETWWHFVISVYDSQVEIDKHRNVEIIRLMYKITHMRREIYFEDA